ncbi:MAG TPA: hypothetical protein VLZ12_02935 [Verrucomicrobiae bacterium]|nr:hypothetical protein [Verrucomicrobiae bacterium]
MRHPISSLHHLSRDRTVGPATGFTLVEVMMAFGAFSLLMAVALTLYVFSMRSFSGLTQQLEFNRQAAAADFMIREVKGATQLAVGSYDGITFVPVGTGTNYQGKALSVMHQVTNETPTQVYYWVDNSNRLYRTSATLGLTKLWCQQVTNSAVFSFTDLSGNTLSNLSADSLVKIDIWARDPNEQNFRQTMNLHTTVARRN